MPGLLGSAGISCCQRNLLPWHKTVSGNDSAVSVLFHLKMQIVPL